MPTLLLFHVGPVQGFIVSARRSRDLWFGSWMLSELSKAAAHAIAKRHDVASLIFPTAETVVDLEPESDLIVANKILAYIEGEVGETPQCVVQAVRGRLDAIAGAAFDFVERKGGATYFDRTNAEAQVRDLPELYWVSAPCRDEANYARARSYLEASMAVRKNTRLFNQPGAWASPQPKSSLDGVRESVIEERLFDQARQTGEVGILRASPLYAYFRARRAERLSGVDLMKRLGRAIEEKNQEAFPSTSHVAALPALARLAYLATKTPRILDYAKTYTLSLDAYLSGEAAQQLVGPFAVPALANYDGAILYEARLHEDDYLTDEHFDALQKARRQFLDDLLGRDKEPSPYYMILQGDGDHMGGVIDAQTTPTAHQTFSRALSGYAAVARKIVEAFGGALVYAGGDDVLAFLPLDTGVTCAHTLAEAFRRLMDGFTDKDNNHPTFSAGLVIAHHLESLSQIMNLARAAEKAAKGVPGKDALAITLSKRSGVDRTIAGHWGTLAPMLDQLTQLMHADDLPAGAAYDLHSLAVRLDAYVDTKPDETFLAIQEKEVERILKRKRSQHGQVPLRSQMVTKPDAPDEKTRLIESLLGYLLPLQHGEPVDAHTPDAVKQFADALVIANLLADAQKLSGREPAVLAKLTASALDNAQRKEATHE